MASKIENRSDLKRISAVKSIKEIKFILEYKDWKNISSPDDIGKDLDFIFMEDTCFAKLRSIIKNICYYKDIYYMDIEKHKKLINEYKLMWGDSVKFIGRGSCADRKFMVHSLIEKIRRGDIK